MFKRARVLGAGLAAALFLTQPAYAAVIITPLDSAEVSSQKQASQASSAAPTSSGTTADVSSTAPGNTAAAVTVSLEGPGAENTSATTGSGTASQTGTVTGNTSAGTTGTAGTAASQVAAPTISAEAGIVYDVTNNRVLFEKNADEKLYPASTTKLMTALLVLEKANLTDTVTFSKTATTNLESGAVTLSLTEGDKLTVETCLYGLLLKSANEVANGLAEHVGGSISGFADLMNAKAAALGCTNTHFVNPNGLNDSNHYTTARDMAKIAAAAFANETLCRIDTTMSYTFPATKKAAARTIKPGHKMLDKNDSRYYAGIVAGKTGYTSLAGNTLVTCVEKNGTRLVAVILKAKGTHYTDTKAMLDYGFEVAAQSTSKTSQSTSQTTSQTAPGTQTASSSEGPGAVSSGWQQVNGTWYYYENGTAVTNQWEKDGDLWFYLGADGSMSKNTWVQNNGQWFYVGADGALVKNQWAKDGSSWFYLGSDGRIVRNSWIDNQYYVGSDGVWVQNKTK